MDREVSSYWDRSGKLERITIILFIAFGGIGMVFILLSMIDIIHWLVTG